jgi:murein DD-endopeptidase MepM/ murein hydrolase activator NlpD
LRSAARWWYTSAVPHRRQARPVRAEPSVTRFLPPQPLAERGRTHGIGSRLVRRSVATVVTVVVLALLVPLIVATLGPSGAPFEPLGGGVAGAVTGSRTAPPSASGPALGSSRPPVRAPDANGGHVMDPQIAPTISSLSGYVWPIQKGRITLPFKAIPGGTRIKDGKLFHDGVDMATFCGAPVGSAHDGVVLAAGRHYDAVVGWIGDLGPYLHTLDVRQMWNDLPNVVVIDDGNGYRSIYAHFRDVTVRPGQQLRAGQLIGHEGQTGHASGCHLHYGLFSPLETRTFGVRADLLHRLKLPKYEIARIDPLLVLPGGDVALRTRSIASAIAAAEAEVPDRFGRGLAQSIRR